MLEVIGLKRVTMLIRMRSNVILAMTELAAYEVAETQTGQTAYVDSCSQRYQPQVMLML